MKPRPRLLLAGFVLGFSTLLSAEDKLAVPFRALPFDDACKAAAAEKKIVFVDFFTTWCGPCKELDRITWNDPAVAALLADKTVPLKIDAEKEKALAKRYGIDAYPTLLLLKADGTELDRLVGYREPAAFVGEFTAGLGGKPALKRAREEAEAAGEKSQHDQVEARYKLARELAQAGNAAEALAEFLWCFDEGMVKESSYSGVRVSFLLSEIERLGRNHPPALAALRERRDAAQQRMLADEQDRTAASDFSALNRTLKDDARTLEVFDLLPARDPRRAAMGYTLFKLLLQQQRYADALAVNPYKRMATQYDRYAAMAAEPAEARFADAQRRLVVTTACEAIETLAGAGDLDHARELGARLLALDPSPATRTAVRERVIRAGHPELFAEPAAK